MYKNLVEIKTWGPNQAITHYKDITEEAFQVLMDPHSFMQEITNVLDKHMIVYVPESC